MKFGRMSKKQREKVEDEVRFHRAQLMAQSDSAPDSSVFEQQTPSSSDQLHGYNGWVQRTFWYFISLTKKMENWCSVMIKTCTYNSIAPWNLLILVAIIVETIWLGLIIHNFTKPDFSSHISSFYSYKLFHDREMAPFLSRISCKPTCIFSLN